MLIFLANEQYSKKTSYENIEVKISYHQKSTEIFLRSERNILYSICKL